MAENKTAPFVDVCAGGCHARDRPDPPLRRLHRAEAPERGPRGGRPVEEVGPVPLRAAVGHGPRGLQRTTATPGTTSRTTSPARGPTAGARTASAGSRDDKQRLCFALALWNGKDPILKERMFGLTNSEANHGEDVKEYYFYVDSTPTHSYMKYLYKYPQGEYPYRDLIETNRGRSRKEFEYELLDTGAFDGRPVLRRLRRVRQGGPGGRPRPGHGPQPRARRRRSSTSSRRSGSATPGPGATASRSPSLRAEGGHDPAPRTPSSAR